MAVPKGQENQHLTAKLAGQGPAGVNGRKTKGASLSVFELLDRALFWGEAFTAPDSKKNRVGPLYHLEGLKRTDSGVGWSPGWNRCFRRCGKSAFRWTHSTCTSAEFKRVKACNPRPHK
jgi:hypothetical protein